MTLLKFIMEGFEEDAVGDRAEMVALSTVSSAIFATFVEVPNFSARINSSGNDGQTAVVDLALDRVHIRYLYRRFMRKLDLKSKQVHNSQRP